MRAFSLGKAGVNGGEYSAGRFYLSISKEENLRSTRVYNRCTSGCTRVVHPGVEGLYTRV